MAYNVSESKCSGENHQRRLWRARNPHGSNTRNNCPKVQVQLIVPWCCVLRLTPACTPKALLMPFNTVVVETVLPHACKLNAVVIAINHSSSVVVETVFSPEFWKRGIQVKSKALVPNPAPILRERHYCAIDCCVLECLVTISEYRSALHAMTLMVGAAASETLIGEYIWTIGGAAPPKTA